ncbi:MAG TPA: hypothetical protein VG164_09535 [Trebonia sp.]|nr:hypothetical protein [Trebonia sp.]
MPVEHAHEQLDQRLDLLDRDAGVRGGRVPLGRDRQVADLAAGGGAQLGGCVGEVNDRGPVCSAGSASGSPRPDSSTSRVAPASAAARAKALTRRAAPGNEMSG